MSHGSLRRLLAGLTSLGAALLWTALPAAAAPPAGALAPDVAVGEGAPPVPAGLSSSSWLVADLTTGRVLAARAGSAKRAPASTQKILTALTFVPGAPGEIAVAPEDTATTGSTVGLRPGVRYPTPALLDAMFVSSGNDVALALARSGGDPAAAGDRMTAVARELGATDTTASNPTGLDADGQLTTPYDLAILTRAALARPEIRRAAGLPEVTVTGSDGRARRFTSSNPLLGRYPGALGVKTGSTNQAGQTFVGAAERDGTTLAVVLMQAPSSFAREATALLDWGFRATSGTRAVAELPPLGSRAAPPAAPNEADEPAVPPFAEDGGGISPLLALALALTVVAAAFTYWQGREELRGDGRRRGDGTNRVIRLPDTPPGTSAAGGRTAGSSGDAVEDGQGQSSSRESRSIFAP